jgi:hypothetical protein
VENANNVFHTVLVVKMGYLAILVLTMLSHYMMELIKYVIHVRLILQVVKNVAVLVNVLFVMMVL